MPARTLQSRPLQLHYRRKNKQVVVTPDDQDRYVLTVEEIIRACQVVERAFAFGQQFECLLEILAGWLLNHRKDIADAVITMRDAGLLFLIIRKEKAYDPAFEDALTNLDVEIAQDEALDLIRLSVLSLPKASHDAIESFFSPKLMLHYNAD